MHIRARQLADDVFAQWEKDGTLDTDWMNSEDKVVFTSSMAIAIARGMDEAVALAKQETPSPAGRPATGG